MVTSSSKKSDGEFILEAFLPYRLSLLSNTVSQGISSAYRNAHGISVTEWRIIAIIGRFPGLVANEIVARTAMDKVAVSRAVSKLQENGLIERINHADDARRKHLYLTQNSGLPLFEKVVPKALAYERALLNSLSENEISKLNILLSKLQHAADALSTK